MNTHTNVLRECAKFLSGLVAADIIAGIWIGSGYGYGSAFLGIPVTQPFINIWIIADFIVFFFLLHYAWHIKLPASSTRKVLYAVVGTVFLIVALIHILRVVFSTQILIGGMVIPVWFSVVGAVVALFLAYASFHFARRK